MAKFVEVLLYSFLWKVEDKQAAEVVTALF